MVIEVPFCFCTLNLVARRLVTISFVDVLPLLPVTPTTLTSIDRDSFSLTFAMPIACLPQK